jgi:hypothetical protein
VLAVPTSHRRAVDALGYQINILMDAVGPRSKEERTNPLHEQGSPLVVRDSRAIMCRPDPPAHAAPLWYPRNHFLDRRRNNPERLAFWVLRSVMVFDARRHHACDLSRFRQNVRFRDYMAGARAMTDVISTVLLFLSAGVFVAHALDAYRTR